MSKKKKILITFCTLVIILILCIVIGVFIWKQNNNPISQNEKYVQILEDGTKLNVSKKLNETKNIDGLEIKEIQLTESGNTTQLLGTITNVSNETKPESIITITFLDEQGNEIAEMKPYIKELKAGESTFLNSSMTFDYAGAYDIRITK